MHAKPAPDHPWRTGWDEHERKLKAARRLAQLRQQKRYYLEHREAILAQRRAAYAAKKGAT